MATRVLAPDEIDVYRAVRLTALRTDPHAFASTHEREAAFTDEEWAARLGRYGDRPGCVVVDESPTSGPQPTSVAGVVGVGLSAEPEDAMLWGMWVRPDARGTGAGERLVEAAVGWAAGQGATTLTLWVVRSNVAAISRYEHSGFSATDSVAVTPDNPCAAELTMRRWLNQPS